MKLLESAPWRYDLDIKLLTLGVDAKIKRRIAEVFIHSSDRVLEVGCGMGTLALMCAHKGASVTGFDVSPVMVELARLKAKREKPAARVQFLEMDVTEMDRFPDGSFDVLVAPTRGINVWCAACGGDFTAHSVIAVIKLSGVSELIRHRLLILPQLSAPGVDPTVIKRETGWSVRFGLVYAKDIPAYLKSGCRKTEHMRKVRFPLSSRLEMAALYAVTLSLLLAPITLLLAPAHVFRVLATLWLVTCGAYVFLPYLPSRSGYVKGLTYGVAVTGAILALAFYTTGSILGWPVTLLVAIFTSIILGFDLNGTTPTFPSDLGRFLYKRGHSEMPFLTGTYHLQPYGDITQDYDRCTGCGVCVEVCPRNVYTLDPAKRKAILARPQDCVNCNACVNRCPQQCLHLV